MNYPFPKLPPLSTRCVFGIQHHNNCSMGHGYVGYVQKCSHILGPIFMAIILGVSATRDFVPR